MVNSKKKINKSTVAIVVLALLLVLSLVLTATGAWFTDKETSNTNKDFTFGTVSIALTGSANNGTWTSTGTGNKVMPGSSFTSTLTLANDGDQDVWVKAAEQTATLSIGGKEVTLTGITVKIELDANGENRDAVENPNSNGVYSLTASAKQDFKVTITVANTVSNEVDGTVLNGGSDAGVTGILTVKLTINAVQKANNDNATFPDTVAESKERTGV